MIFSGRAVTTLIMLAIFAGMTVIGMSYPDKARMMPLLVGIPGTILALAQLIHDIRFSEAKAVDVDTSIKRRREIKMFFWLALFFAGVMSFGFVYAAPILVFAFLLFGQKESLTVALFGGVGAWVILYGVFTRLLELFLFEGLLLPLLVG
jgi:fatty acid desaturase